METKPITESAFAMPTKPEQKDYNDATLTVQIPLREYRDMITTLTSQRYENWDLQIEIQRIQATVKAAQRSQEDAEERYEDLEQRYTLVEEWLNSSSYYSDVFESWVKERNKKPEPKFSDSDLVARLEESDKAEDK